MPRRPTRLGRQSPAMNHRTYERSYPAPGTRADETPPVSPYLWMNSHLGITCSVSQRVADCSSALFGVPTEREGRGVVQRRDNVLLVHWHDLGRYLGAYGHTDVESPR